MSGGTEFLGRLVRGVANRGRGLRNRARLRGLALHDFEPAPALVTDEHLVERPRTPAVDVHNHLGRWLNGGRHWMVPDVGRLVAELDALDVETTVNLDGLWGDELDANLRRYDEAHPGRFLTFCQPDWSLLGDRAFPRALPALMRRSAARGAAGVKVWKDLGLRARDHEGTLVQTDDPRLADLWDTIGEIGLPVLIHVADPVAFWRPRDRRNERFEELAAHPDWSYATQAVPSHGALLDAFERTLAAHRGTMFVAAHLASSATDLAQVSRMLDEHPNLMVDTAACEAELGRQPRAAAAFLARHAGRVLWGTDSFPLDPAQYRTWYRMLETADEYFPYSTARVPPQGRWAVSGLALDPDVLTALYSEAARTILPTIRR